MNFGELIENAAYCGAYFSPLGCVYPASWLPLITGVGFTQPLREKIALSMSMFCPNKIEVIA